MPIFEYKCKDCNNLYEVFHKVSEKKEDIICPKCNSKNYIKLISKFSSLGLGNELSDDTPCSTGSCDLQYNGGCANGMCGLN